MRATLLSGIALFAAIAAAAIAPAHAQQTGGISITHGGGNVNTARGAFSQADQSVTTLGGIARGRGVAITNGVATANAGRLHHQRWMRETSNAQAIGSRRPGRLCNELEQQCIRGNARFHWHGDTGECSCNAAGSAGRRRNVALRRQ
jgi:hypothetical protein